MGIQCFLLNGNSIHNVGWSMEEIIWQHPVQMIMSASEVVYGIKDKYTFCVHMLSKPILPYPDGLLHLEGSVRYERITIQLRPYMFPFETLNFGTFVYMNLCVCGKLYIGQSIKIEKREDSEWR